MIRRPTHAEELQNQKTWIGHSLRKHPAPGKGLGIPKIKKPVATGIPSQPVEGEVSITIIGGEDEEGYGGESGEAVSSSSLIGCNKHLPRQNYSGHDVSWLLSSRLPSVPSQ
ncbi:hypothetical protein Tco_0893259 [Tanacetum coccineum]|uniref:Uncharacterized protein n=1 Tax=Tanacetum coccineum TaxID=301880 RepID=A0ABQ5CB60_9ASTR